MKDKQARRDLNRALSVCQNLERRIQRLERTVKDLEVVAKHYKTHTHGKKTDAVYDCKYNPVTHEVTVTLIKVEDELC